MDTDLTQLLFKLQSEVSTTLARFEAFAQNYDHGRSAQILKAQEDQKNFESLKKTLEDVRDALEAKVDRKEIEPILTANVLFKNWKVILSIFLVLSTLGLVSLKDDVLAVVKILVLGK